MYGAWRQVDLRCVETRTMAHIRCVETRTWQDIRCVETRTWQIYGTGKTYMLVKQRWLPLEKA